MDLVTLVELIQILQLVTRISILLPHLKDSPVKHVEDVSQSKLVVEFIKLDFVCGLLQIGLTLRMFHGRTRRNSNCAEVNSSLVVDIEGKAQNHSTSMSGFPFVHSLMKHDLKFDVDLKRRLQLPDPKNTDLWKKIDQRIMDGVNGSMSRSSQDTRLIDSVVKNFELHVYTATAEFCPSPLLSTSKNNGSRSGALPTGRTVERLRKIKRSLRRDWRDMKTKFGERSTQSGEAFKLFIAAVSYTTICCGWFHQLQNCQSRLWSGNVF